MLTFYITLITAYIGSFLARIAYDKKYRYIGFFWLLIVMLTLIVVSGLRSGIGDTIAYKNSYNLLVQNPNSFKFQGDFALDLLSLILINISTNPQILIFTVSLITNMTNVVIFNKYRSYLEVQIYLYIASGYYLTTMNGLRQCLAAAILFYFSNLIIEGKFKKFLITVLFVSTIHGTALIMIPIYFIVRQKAWSKKIIRFIILSVIGIMLYKYLEPILFNLLENTRYKVYANTGFTGSSFTRTLVNLVPSILAYLKRDKIKEVWPEGNIFVNFSILNAIFVAFGMYDWIFNRFTLYLQLYNFILIPYILKNVFEGKEKRIIYIATIICYFIFFYREQVIGLNIKYGSEYLNFKKIFYNNIN